MTADEVVDALLHFLSREADLRLRPDPYHLRDLAGQARDAFSGRPLDEAFAGRLRGALYDGLCRLDALPRDDPFWQGGNRRADALEEAGCGAAGLLAHLRGPGPHGRCCWVVAALLGEG